MQTFYFRKCKKCLFSMLTNDIALENENNSSTLPWEKILIKTYIKKLIM